VLFVSKRRPRAVRVCNLEKGGHVVCCAMVVTHDWDVRTQLTNLFFIHTHGLISGSR
jgi:ribosomal protein S12 methylthiotransferase accessory factor YcaO